MSDLSAGGVALSVLRTLPLTSTLVFDEELRFVLAAGQALECFGAGAIELEGRQAPEVLPAERWEIYGPLFDAALRGETRSLEVWSMGDTNCYQVEVSPLHGEEGEILGGTAVFRDITPRKHAEEARRHAQERFELVFEQAPIGMALLTPDGRWVRVNQALLKITGYSSDELLRKTFQEITHPDDLTLDAEHMRRLLVGEIRDYQIEKRYQHAQGHVISATLSVSLVRDLQGKPLHFVAQIQDITERKLMEERLRHLAEHDPLTGIRNRRFFEHELGQQVRRCQRYGEQAALLVIDLDDFKQVNDLHGHKTGDDLLKAVAHELEQRLRGTDLVARLGGDEFAVLLPGTSGEAAQRVARDLARVIADCAIIVADQRIATTASVGVGLIDRATQSHENVLIEADRAMYAAKDARHGAPFGRDGTGTEPAVTLRTSPNTL
ncbi:MAG TPA: diguanylate cyclase [Solirubrobacteraceae bacterium]|jgi:diguanylate cyclase (GGDEF)-like protein/PAS domain S-box-containing protein|nr:diguanylate cyclase [Solirubrobacteraceae bacterium]